MPVHAKRLSGFTLVELMIVIAIISVLSAIAIPAYNEYMTRGKLADGIAALSSYQTRIEQYYQDNRSYGPSSGGACGVAGSGSTYFTITCTTTTGQDFTAKATSTTLGIEYDVNEAGTKWTPTVASGWTAIPKTSATPCWVRSKGGC